MPFSCPFLATENGDIIALSEGLNDCISDRDLDEGQSEFPDLIDEYKSASCCLFLVLFWQQKMVKLVLSKGVSGRLPDLVEEVGYFDEGQTEFQKLFPNHCRRKKVTLEQAQFCQHFCLRPFLYFAYFSIAMGKLFYST